MEKIYFICLNPHPARVSAKPQKLATYADKFSLADPAFLCIMDNWLIVILCKAQAGKNLATDFAG